MLLSIIWFQLTLTMRWEEKPNKKRKTDYRQHNVKFKIQGNQQYFHDQEQIIYIPRSKLNKMESQVRQLKQQIIRQKHAMRKQIVELNDRLDAINTQNKLARRQQVYLRHIKKSMSQNKIGKLEGFSQKIPINRYFKQKNGIKTEKSQQNKEFNNELDDYMFGRNHDHNRHLLQQQNSKDYRVGNGSLDTKMRSRKQFWY